MSAFILNKRHIDAMVTAALRTRYRPFSYYVQGERREVAHETADETGELLWTTNYASVNYRYDEHGTAPPYRHSMRPPDANLSIPQLLKLVDCYEYQSCEHPGWNASWAKAFCDQLRHDLITRLPGYDEAAWELT